MHSQPVPCSVATTSTWQRAPGPRTQENAIRKADRFVPGGNKCQDTCPVSAGPYNQVAYPTDRLKLDGDAVDQQEIRDVLETEEEVERESERQPEDNGTPDRRFAVQDQLASNPCGTVCESQGLFWELEIERHGGLLPARCDQNRYRVRQINAGIRLPTHCSNTKSTMDSFRDRHG